MRFGTQMMAADAEMETTCPSPEIPNDSRKRPLDGDSDNGSTKRSHFSGECNKKKHKKNES
jgi:RNA-binding protein Nova